MIGRPHIPQHLAIAAKKISSSATLGGRFSLLRNWPAQYPEEYLYTSMDWIWIGSLKFVIKASGVYKRDYTFRMNVMEEIFEIRSCIEIRANDISQYS